MLYHPSDAEDAEQEIMIKIVTHVGAFEGRCSFKTYAFRIASNHLRTLRRRRPELEFGSLDEMSGGRAGGGGASHDTYRMVFITPVLG